MSDISEELFTDPEPEVESLPSYGTVVAVELDGVRLRFDGEEEPTQKLYRYLMSCAGLQPNDRVLLHHGSGTSVIVGVLAPPERPVSVGYADRAGHADTADEAEKASEAALAYEADRAKTADKATTADTAANATNATLAQRALRVSDRINAGQIEIAYAGNNLFRLRAVNMDGNAVSGWVSLATT